MSSVQQSPDTSFSGAAADEELQELKKKLSEEEANSRELQQRLQASEQLLQEKESAHTEQVTQLRSRVVTVKRPGDDLV